MGLSRVMVTVMHKYYSCPIIKENKGKVGGRTGKDGSRVTCIPESRIILMCANPTTRSLDGSAYVKEIAWALRFLWSHWQESRRDDPLREWAISVEACNYINKQFFRCEVCHSKLQRCKQLSLLSHSILMQVYCVGGPAIVSCTHYLWPTHCVADTYSSPTFNPRLCSSAPSCMKSTCYPAYSLVISHPFILSPPFHHEIKV